MTNIKINKKEIVEIKKVSDNVRTWHPNFLEYAKLIVDHENYSGLFYESGVDKKPRWVITGKSENGRKRKEWWDAKCEEHGIEIKPGCYAKIALLVHPTKLHVCQICGNKLRLDYVYPNSKTLNSINKKFELSILPFTYDIFEIIDKFVKTESDIKILQNIFNIKGDKISKDEIKNLIKVDYVEGFSKGYLSPGAMSNSPDRFDGFHSDGACCRHKSDKGRHKDNLIKYSQDRRVYENWADGDWKMADRLMALFRKHKLSADHIGPISLGFCHRPKFIGMSREDNSAKNNRMTHSDVKILIEDEKTETVISWHSKSIWDKLKNKVGSNADAVKLSELMRKNLHYVLTLFSMISDKGYDEFLKTYLNPEYSFFDYTFEGFDPETFKFNSVKQVKKIGKNQRNNVERYERVAFEALEQYKNKENRRSKKWNESKIDSEIETLIELLSQNKTLEAKDKVLVILDLLSDIAVKNWEDNQIPKELTQEA